GMALATADVALRALGMAPVGAVPPRPPVVEVAQVDRALRLAEDERAGHEILGLGAGVVLRARRLLGPGDVAGLLHEAPELGHGHGMTVDREVADRHLADRALLGVEPVRPHPERPARHLDHALRAHGAKSVALRDGL